MAKKPVELVRVWQQKGRGLWAVTMAATDRGEEHTYSNLTKEHAESYLKMNTLAWQEAERESRIAAGYGDKTGVILKEAPAAAEKIVAKTVRASSVESGTLGIRRIIDLHRRQLFGLVEIRGVERLRPSYDQARVELERKLKRLVRGGKGQTFQAHHVRQVLAQVVGGRHREAPGPLQGDHPGAPAAPGGGVPARL